jgi:hypothetical protein
MSTREVPVSPTELAKNLPRNIQYLASLIARKPAEFTPEWAATVEEAFSLYTRTRAVNMLLAWNDVLTNFNWPFPGYIDLRCELPTGKGKPVKGPALFSGIMGKVLTTVLEGRGREQNARVFLDIAMPYLFQRQSESVFQYWSRHPLLNAKQPILENLYRCYNAKLWAACVPTALPLLDHVMRSYFATDKLRVSVQTLRDAFEKARILPKDLKPGFAVWDGARNPDTGNSLTTSLEKDLRLPGVFLSSFAEFAGRYYAWYKSTAASPPDELNRHAIMHCACEYWTELNTAKLFTFFDLMLRIEKPLCILIHGAPSAVAALADGP